MFEQDEEEEESMRKTTGWGLSGATMLAFVGAIMFAGLAFAQATPPAGQEPPKPAQEEPREEGRKEFVDEVVVTAQKRTEDVQEVPVAITAVLAQDLAVIMAGGQDIRFLSARVPSLTLESVVRPRLPALLHARPRQHRLRPQRVAARLDDR